MGLGLRQLREYESPLHHSIPVTLSKQLTLSELCFFMCKMNLVMISTSKGFNEDQMKKISEILIPAGIQQLLIHSLLKEIPGSLVVFLASNV